MDVISFILILLLSIYCSYTDFKSGIIKNKVLLSISLIGLINIAIYIWNNRIYTNLYVINLIVVCIVSILLYAIHIWAAGDSKLFIVIGLILCPKFCAYDAGILWTGVIIPIIAFAMGFIVAFFESIIIFISKKEQLNIPLIKKESKRFIKNYFINIVYITLIYKLENILLKDKFEKYLLVLIVLNCAFILFISTKQILRKLFPVLIVLITSIVISLVSGNWFVAGRLKTYCFLIAFMFIRIVINSYNYKFIHVDELKKGMILSSFTTVFFVKSRVKNLPGISTEDLRSRLTDEEVEAVKRWSQTKQGSVNIQIVKKVPFAIYITLGIIAQFVIWGSMEL